MIRQLIICPSTVSLQRQQPDPHPGPKCGRPVHSGGPLPGTPQALKSLPVDRRGNCIWVFQPSGETMERLDACCCRQRWWWVEPVGGPGPLPLQPGHWPRPPPRTFRRTHGELLKQLEAQDGFFFYFLLLVELEVLLCTHAHTSGGFFFLFFSIFFPSCGGSRQHFCLSSRV